MQFQDSAQETTENQLVDILTSAGIPCQRHNLTDVKAVDIVTKQGTKIDAQYSNNFAKYGDCRLDVISVFTPRMVTAEPNYIYDPQKSFFHNFQDQYHCKIQKIGKIFQPDYVDWLGVLFYNERLRAGQEPDFLLLIPCAKLIQMFRENPETYFHQIVLNNKYGLPDNFGSAFVPLNAQNLAKATGGFFGTVPDFMNFAKTFHLS